jgi:hypothetical protein
VSAKSGKERQKERDALIAAYREGLGLVAIVFSNEDHEFRLAADRGVSENAPERWWCRNGADAERVVSAANAGLRRKSASGDLDADSREAVPRAAKRLNVALRSDRDNAEEAAVVIDRIAVEFEQLRNSGSLRPVNKSYRDYRLEAAARGERIVPYAQWMRTYRQNLVRQAAVTLRFL